MEDFNRILITKMKETGMIPVFNHSDIEVAKAVLDACYVGGVRVFEFTNRSENSLSVFKSLKKHSAKYPDLFLGIGTVFSVVDADEFLDAGADFIVSPSFVEEVARFCQGNGAFYIPGCGTITEIHQAKKMGASLVKAFPGNVLGPDFIAAAKSVFPDLGYMPTGGVEPNRENLKKWFDAGVTCVGMGSQLFKKEWIIARDYQQIGKEVANTLQIIQSLMK